MSTRDLYEILGVSRTASDEEIKRAYRRLAKQFHPDRNANNPESEEKFKEVQHAYSVLRDKEKRAQYDRYGEVGVGDFRTDPSGEKVYTWGSGSKVNVEDLEDLFSAFEGRGGPFESIFGRVGGARNRSRRKARPQPRQGADRKRRLNLGFEQAVQGVAIEVDVNPRSNGGKRETLEVRIPPGVEDGQQIRVPGKGEPGESGGPPGDLFLICTVRPHAYFRRQGRDIYLDLPVSFAEAALGAKIDVPTMNGQVTLNVPPGTSSGAKLRLKGRGVPADGSHSAGDQYAVVKVVAPEKLSDEQKELLEKLAETLSDDPRAKVEW